MHALRNIALRACARTKPSMVPRLYRTYYRPSLATNQHKYVLTQVRSYSAGGPPTREQAEQTIIKILQDFDKVTDPSKVNAN